MADIIWPFAAYPDSRSETYEYKTQVLEKRGGEQRFSLRDYPIFTAQQEFEVTPAQAGAAKMLSEDMYDSNNRVLQPLWTERTFIGETLSGPQTRITADMRYTRVGPGSTALVWVSPDEYYVVNVVRSQENRCIIEEYNFPDLTGKTALLIPAVPGRIDGETAIKYRDGNRHLTSYDFRAQTDRVESRYKMRVMIAMDFSGSMVGSRETAMKAAVDKLLVSLGSICESCLVDLSIAAVVWADGYGMETANSITDRAQVDALRAYVAAQNPSGGTSVSAAINAALAFFPTDDASDNVMLLLGDGEAQDQEAAELLAADLLDRNTDPYRILRGTSVRMVAVGVEAPDSALASLSAFDNTTEGPLANVSAASGDASAVKTFNATVFGEHTPLSGIPGLLDAYDGKSVVTRKDRVLTGLKETVVRSRTAFVTPSGIDWVTDDQNYTTGEFMLTLETIGDADRYAVVTWLTSLRGKRREFLMPTLNRDLSLTQSMSQPDTLVVKRAGLDNPYRLVGRVIQIELESGQKHYRTITAAGLSSNTAVSVTLDTALPKAYSRREMIGIHFLERFRLDTDAVTINHENVHQCRVSAVVKKLKGYYALAQESLAGGGGDGPAVPQ